MTSLIALLLILGRLSLRVKLGTFRKWIKRLVG